jgi:hypothetical protein
LHKNIGQILKEFLSFGSPRAVVANFSMIFIIIGIVPTAFWDTAPDLCIWHRFILPIVFNNNCPSAGIFADCHIPSCGLTHAFSALLHGNFSDAYSFNHLVYFVLTIMLIIYFKNIYKLFCIK